MRQQELQEQLYELGVAQQPMSSADKFHHDVAFMDPFVKNVESDVNKAECCTSQNKSYQKQRMYSIFT